MGGNHVTTISQYVGVQHYTTFGSSFLEFSEGISYKVYLAHPLHQNKLHFNLVFTNILLGHDLRPHLPVPQPQRAVALAHHPRRQSCMTLDCPSHQPIRRSGQKTTLFYST